MLLKKILRNSAYLAIGSIIGKASMFLVFIIIARSLGPASFGVYSTAFNHVFILGIFSKLGFDMVVVREGSKMENEFHSFFDRIFPIRFWFSIIGFFFSVLFAYLINYNDEVIEAIWILSPLIISGGAISAGLIDHYNTYFNITQDMKYVSYIMVFRTIVFAICILLLYVANLLNLNLILLLVLGISLISLLFQNYLIRKYYHQNFLWKIEFKFFRTILKPTLLFGLASLLYEFSLRVNILMLEKLDNSESAGLYNAAWNFVSVGILFISSFSIAIFPNSAQRIFHKEFRNKMLVGLIVGSLLISIVCFASSFLFDIVIITTYGDGFIRAAEILFIIVWFLPMRLLSIWGHQTLESANYLSLRIWIFFIPTFVGVLLNYFWIPDYGVIGSAYATLVSNLLILLFSIIAAFFVIKNDERFI